MKENKLDLEPFQVILQKEFSQAVENEGVLWYKPVGHRLLDVYAEK